jgi:hypothetical protein
VNLFSAAYTLSLPSLPPSSLSPSLPLQVDDGVRTDPATHAITHIMHQPLDPSKLYSMATTWGVISGIDDLRPILGMYVKLGVRRRLGKENAT